MPDTFVGISELVIDRAVGSEDKDVLVGQMSAVSALAEMFGFSFEKEGSGGSDLFEELLPREVYGIDLSPDGLEGFTAHGNLWVSFSSVNPASVKTKQRATKSST